MTPPATSPPADPTRQAKSPGGARPAQNGARPAQYGARRARRAPARPTVVLLVRHGHTPTTGKVLPGRQRGLHLSDDGRAAALGVATRIAALPRLPVAVYTSPLERARETAAPIARALGVRAQTERALLECDTGEWTGAELAGLTKAPEWAGVHQFPAGFRFPGGESFAELSTRVFDGILRLAARHPSETIVAVSHADPIKAAAAVAAGMGLDTVSRLVVSPCSVTALALARPTPFLLCLNATAGLDELVVS